MYSNDSIHQANKLKEDIGFLCKEFQKYNEIDPELTSSIQVKKGLRNADGTGVVAGVSSICNVHGYVLDEGEISPIDGRLTYRGYNIHDIVNACVEQNRFGYEEVCWLLLFGSLPSPAQLDRFCEILNRSRELPEGFNEDMIFNAPSLDIMNKLGRSVLALYSYDDNPNLYTLENVLRQSIQLIARMPTIMSSAYQIKRRYYDHKSMYLHPIKPGLSTAESILRSIRPDKQYTDEEAKLLDICLMLHAEHGGGNNSTFACRVLSSSGTDTYAAISAAIGSLKGPKHGGANLKVIEMMAALREETGGACDEESIRAFLRRVLKKEAGDGSGLIYGMGHAVYTKSDPRAIILKENARKLAFKLGFERDFERYELVEQLSPSLFAEVKGQNKPICANVDLYSGFVYQMLRIPPELYTPLFAISRMAGWSAHRIEELTTCNRIIRPAYKPAVKEQKYIPLEQR